MRTRRIILCAAVAAALSAAAVTTARAQKEGWQAKPYQQWTKEEVQRILTESPWAQTSAQSGQIVGSSMSADKVYTLRLRSALPIRHALLRLRQLNDKYDSMSAEKKAEFDEKNKPLVECPACADNYVVSLVPPAQGDARRVSLDRMKLFVRLVDDRGRERQLVHFVPHKTTGQELVFFFPKFDDKGEPLVTPATKKVVFTIDTSVIGLDATTRRFEFDVSKMTAGGKVEF